MAVAPTIDETNVTTTTPLPTHLRRRRFVALYAFLGLLAIIIGVLVGVQHHRVVADRLVAVPTEQSVVATALPGLPTPTPLATRQPSPTAIPPTEPPSTVAPPTPVPPAAPVVALPVRSVPTANGNQNGQHDTGKGRGKEKDKGD